MRFGVPDFKIEKWIVERRVRQLVDEGVDLRLGVDVGRDVSYDDLRARHDAVVIATGSRVPRDLPVPGRELDGVHYAMDYLYGRNRAVAANGGAPAEITAREKHVIVYCANGNRSVFVADVMQQMGYGDVQSMASGFNGWIAAGGDVEE